MPSPNTHAGLGTAPGVRHADMHPLTKRRVDAQAEAGRAIAAYAEASRLLGAGEVNQPYVTRKKDELTQALAHLVEAAQEEGAYDPALEEMQANLGSAPGTTNEVRE